MSRTDTPIQTFAAWVSNLTAIVARAYTDCTVEYRYTQDFPGKRPRCVVCFFVTPPVRDTLTVRYADGAWSITTLDGDVTMGPDLFALAAPLEVA